MTDERQPGDLDPASGSPTSASPPEPPAQPAAGQAAGEPPPLAPLVGQARTTSDTPLDDTTAQPTGSWAAPAASYTPPPIPPPAVQPAVAWERPPASIAAVGQRTALSAAAGILLIVLGILGGLAGLGIAVIGQAVVRSIRDFGPMPEIEGVDTETFLSGFVVFFGIIIMIYSLMYLFAGIGVLRSRDWGRVLGLIVGILSGVIWLGGMSGARRTVGDDIALAVIAIAIHVYIVVALLFFWRTKPASG